MARPLRIKYDGAMYHVTSRGNERKAIFRYDADRELFLATFFQVSERFDWLCHAYCLMDNHYHLVIETPDGNLSKGMRQINGVYTQAFNRRHHRVGHLFQGWFKGILVQKESHFLEVCRYVVLNPVKAKVVEHPRKWAWTSYRATGGLTSVPRYLTVREVLRHFGQRRGPAQEKYRNYVMRESPALASGRTWRPRAFWDWKDSLTRSAGMCPASEGIERYQRGKGLSVARVWISYFESVKKNRHANEQSGTRSINTATARSKSPAI